MSQLNLYTYHSPDNVYPFDQVIDRVNSILSLGVSEKNADIKIDVTDLPDLNVNMSTDKKRISITLSDQMSKPDAAMIIGMMTAEVYANRGMDLLSKKISKQEASEMLNARWKLIETQLYFIKSAICHESGNDHHVSDVLDKIIGNSGELIQTNHVQLNALMNDLASEFNKSTGEHLDKTTISSLVASLMMRSDVFAKMSFINKENVQIPSEFISRLVAESTVMDMGTDMNIQSMAIGGLLARLIEEETGEVCDINKEWMPTEDEFHELVSSHAELKRADAPVRNKGMI